jgi:hypothetical protein
MITVRRNAGAARGGGGGRHRHELWHALFRFFKLQLKLLQLK